MALNSCAGTLAGDLLKNCTDPIIGGVEKVGWLINREDIDIAATKASKVAGSNNIYASLVLKSTKKGYKVSNFTNEATTKVDGVATNKFQHVVNGMLLDDGDTPASVIESLASKDAEFVAVIEYKYKDLARSTNPGSSAFHIIGLDVPLTSDGQEIKNDKSSADTDGGWSFSLACTDRYARTSWLSTSYSATKALFDALGTPVV